MNQNMLSPNRRLGVYVQMVLPTGTVLDLDGAQVMNFTVEEGADRALLPGGVFSASLRLELANDEGQWRFGGGLRAECPLVGAAVSVNLMLNGERRPCGVYIIDSVSAKERGGTVVLTGRDSADSALSAPFRDDLKYPAALETVFRHWLSQTRFQWTGVLPNADQIIDRRPRWGKITLRKAAGWIAQAAGCFMRIGRSGELEVLPCVGSEVVSLNPDAYWNLHDGFQHFGSVTVLQVTPAGADEPFTVTRGAGGETLSVAGNPLFQSGAKHVRALADGLLTHLAGMDLNRMQFSWRGDPSVGVGTKISLTDTYGRLTLCTVTRQTLKFGGGFEAQCLCEVPERAGSAARILTPEGGLNGSALTGTVDGGLLAAESVAAKSVAARAITSEKLDAGAVTAEKLDAGAVTAEKLDAGAVTAEKIQTGAVTAEKLDADSVSARTAQFVAAEIMKLNAGVLDTSTLYAAAAHLVDLAAKSIAADSVQADRLASAIVEAVNVHAAVGEFDLATVQNLVASALVLEKGAADSMQISNLTVTSANLLGAVIGKLTLRGGDGRLYRLTVGTDGVVHAREVQEGDPLDVEGDVPSADAQSVQSASGLLSEVVTKALTAGKITAGEALLASASVPTLYTSAVKALGGSMDLSANDAIRLILGQLHRMNLWFTFDDAQGLVIQKPEWTDAQGVVHPASVWRTITDETGYHIKRADLPGYVASFVRDRMVADGVQIGKIAAVRTDSGGWAWVDA